MEVVASTRRVNGGRAYGFARRATAAIAAAWHTPRQRTIALALVAVALSGLSFARITEDYLTNDPLARWDLSFARWLSDERSAAGTDVFRAVTFFGSPAVALAVAAAFCAVLYRRRQLVDAAFLPVVLGGAELLNLILKLSFHRSRPEVALVHLDTYSFPSGHAMISAAAYGALAYLAWGRLRRRRSRMLLAGGTTVLIALIGFSRLYLGVHYLSDVLAGIAGGAFWLALSIVIQATYGDRFASRYDGSRVDRLARRITRS